MFQRDAGIQAHRSLEILGLEAGHLVRLPGMQKAPVPSAPTLHLLLEFFFLLLLFCSPYCSRTHQKAQSSLRLMVILLPQTPDYRHEPAHPASCYFERPFIVDSFKHTQGRKRGLSTSISRHSAQVTNVSLCFSPCRLFSTSSFLDNLKYFLHIVLFYPNIFQCLLKTNKVVFLIEPQDQTNRTQQKQQSLFNIAVMFHFPGLPLHPFDFKLLSC